MTTTADDILRRMAFDDTTGAMLTMDTIHHEVHEGEMYRSGYTFASVSNGSTVAVLLLTGEVETHIAWEVFAGGQVSVYLYEDPTLTEVESVPQYGTAVTIYNMKRDDTRVPTALFYHTPTVSDAGTTALVNGRVLPGGTSPQTRVGGGIHSSAEWIFAPETVYLMRVTNSSGSTIAVNISLEWYEEAVV